jgi:hypothetical protein
MGKNMMFRFQTKEGQTYLMNQDDEGNGLWVEPWLQSEDPSPALPKSKKNKKVWRVKNMSPSSTSPPGMDEWTSS